MIRSPPADYIPAGKDLHGRGPALDVDDHTIAEYYTPGGPYLASGRDQLLADLDALLATEINQSPVAAPNLLQIALQINRRPFDCRPPPPEAHHIPGPCRPCPPGLEGNQVSIRVTHAVDRNARRRRPPQSHRRHESTRPGPSRTPTVYSPERVGRSPEPAKSGPARCRRPLPVQEHDIAVAEHAFFVFPFRSNNLSPGISSSPIEKEQYRSTSFSGRRCPDRSWPLVIGSRSSGCSWTVG